MQPVRAADGTADPARLDRCGPRAVRRAQRRPRGDGPLPGAARRGPRATPWSTASSRRCAGAGFGLWAVEVIGGPACIGFVGLNPIPFDASFTPALEVGWRLARSAWGQGYAPEAAVASVDFAFASVRRDGEDFAMAGSASDERLDEIVSMTTPDNTKSRRGDGEDRPAPATRPTTSTTRRWPTARPTSSGTCCTAPTATSWAQRNPELAELTVRSYRRPSEKVAM